MEERELEESADGVTVERILATFAPVEPIPITMPQLAATPIRTSATPAPLMSRVSADGMVALAAPVTALEPYDLLLAATTGTVFKAALAGNEMTIVLTTSLLGDELALMQLEIVAARMQAANSGDHVWIVVPNGKVAGDGLLQLANQYDNVTAMDQGGYIIKSLDAELSGRGLVRVGFEYDRRVLDNLEVVVPTVGNGMMVYLLNVFLAAFSRDPAFIEMVREDTSVRRLVLEAGRSLVGPVRAILIKAIEAQASLLTATQA